MRFGYRRCADEWEPGAPELCGLRVPGSLRAAQRRIPKRLHTAGFVVQRLVDWRVVFIDALVERTASARLDLAELATCVGPEASCPFMRKHTMGLLMHRLGAAEATKVRAVRSG